MLSLNEILKKKFRLEGFQGYQEAACEALIRGEDVVIIAPTGSGKSLCYQLPSLVRKGTGLVISPLISLMNDQASKLRMLGFKAASLNSSNSHLLNWQILLSFSAQNLDFLFVTPERLKEKNFSEALKNASISLIAVDEAHCISMWGHDFRPEYRLIKNGLSVIHKRPPIIALSATATQSVQQDIIQKLDLKTPRKFTSSFWRENIAIKTLETPAEHRLDLILKLLSDPSALPAIIYAVSRKECEFWAEGLRSKVNFGIYHAGLPHSDLMKTQKSFLGGNIEVLSATAAFGMGIDTPNVRTIIHAGLPPSLEQYSQEIGRAGRDGGLAEALLLYSRKDLYFHEMLLGSRYPSIKILKKFEALLDFKPKKISEIAGLLPLEPSEFERAIEIFLSYGVAKINGQYIFKADVSDWEKTYLTRLKKKTEDVLKVYRFAETTQCRMNEISSYFDSNIQNRSCKICDICIEKRSLSLELSNSAIAFQDN